MKAWLTDWHCVQLVIKFTLPSNGFASIEQSTLSRRIGEKTSIRINIRSSLPFCGSRILAPFSFRRWIANIFFRSSSTNNNDESWTLRWHSVQLLRLPAESRALTKQRDADICLHPRESVPVAYIRAFVACSTRRSDEARAYYLTYFWSCTDAPNGVRAYFYS